jgi:hypothetical protein
MRPKSTGVLFISFDRLQMFVSSSPEILEYRFKPESIDHLNVTNKGLFAQEIAAFIQSHNIPQSNLVIVIANNASSIKEIQQKNPEASLKDEAVQGEIKAFLSTVPFGHIVSKTIITPNAIQVYAVNYELCDALKEAFEGQGFEVDFILPALVFDNDLGEQTSLTLRGAGLVFQEAFAQEKYNLMPTQMVPDEEIRKAQLREQTKHDILRLYAATTVFGVLIIGLAVAWTVYQPNPQTYRGKAETNQPAVLMPSAQESKEITVDIANGAASPQIATQIWGSLKKYNFRNVTIQNKHLPEGTEGVIVFSGKVSPTARAAIITEVKRFVATVTVRERTDATSNVVIILPEK